MNSSKSLLKREAILLAASDIIRKEGVSRLTLDAVAAKAGVSKGGLLYHFSNKESLIRAMVTDLTESYENDIFSRVNLDPHQTGKWQRAYVEATFAEVDNGLERSSALLAAVFTNPDLLQELQKQYASWQEMLLSDQKNEVKSMIIRLAADGLWFSELFGLAPLDKELKDKIRNELIHWTKEEG